MTLKHITHLKDQYPSQNLDKILQESCPIKKILHFQAVTQANSLILKCLKNFPISKKKFSNNTAKWKSKKAL